MFLILNVVTDTQPMQIKEKNASSKLKFIITLLTSYNCYSGIPTFCDEGRPKMIDFGYFVLIWQQSHKKQEILKQSRKDLLFWHNYQFYSFNVYIYIDAIER